MRAVLSDSQLEQHFMGIPGTFELCFLFFKTIKYAPRCLYLATGSAQDGGGGSCRLLVGVAQYSDAAGRLSFDGGGARCDQGGSVRAATGCGVDRDSGSLVAATAAAGSNAGESGAIVLTTGSTSAGSSGFLSLTTGTAVSGSGITPVFYDILPCLAGF